MDSNSPITETSTVRSRWFRWWMVLTALIVVVVGLLIGFFFTNGGLEPAPVITTKNYLSNQFELTDIIITNDYPPVLQYRVTLHTEIAAQSLCNVGQILAHSLLVDYPYEGEVVKKIIVRFQPPPGPDDPAPDPALSYELGEVNLMDNQREMDGSFGCSLKYQ